MKATLIPIEVQEAIGSVMERNALPVFGEISSGYGQVTGLQSFVMPRDFNDQLRMAKEYRKVDIIQRLMKIRIDFGSKIKGFEYPTKKSQPFWDSVFKKARIKRFARNFLYDLNTLGVVHPLWEIDESGPLFLTIYDPELVETISALGQEAYFITPDEGIFRIIRELNQEQKKRIYIPDYLEDAARTAKRKIAVPRDRMIRISLQKQDYEANPTPPLLSIYDSLALRKLLIETDFSTAYGIKNEIIHVTEGEKENRTTEGKLKKLEELFKKQGKSILLFTNHTVKINRITPDAGVWNPDKYKAAEDRIFTWGGITKTLITGEGASYASAYISIKALRESMRTDREHFEEFFEYFCEQVAAKTGQSKRGIPKIKWDTTSLREDKVFIQELEFLSKWGILDPEDLCNEFDIDYEKQVAKRKANMENNDFFIPHFEPSQGLLANKFGVGSQSKSDDKGGRPSTGVRPQTSGEPRPSTS